MSNIYLCVVIDRDTGKELASYEIEFSLSENIYFSYYDKLYYSKHRAAVKFREEFKPNKTVNWYVDSVEINV